MARFYARRGMAGISLSPVYGLAQASPCATEKHVPCHPKNALWNLSKGHAANWLNVGYNRLGSGLWPLPSYFSSQQKKCPYLFHKPGPWQLTSSSKS
jgi:hypothetical protein